MRHKHVLLTGSFLVLVWTACKKNDPIAVTTPTPVSSVPTAADAKERADMQMMIYLGLNGVISEGNLVPLSMALKGLITEDSLLSLGATLLGIPPSLTCGATITPPPAIGPAFTYYTYNGNNCHGFSVEGNIGIIVDTLRMEYFMSLNLVLTRLSDGRKFGLYTQDYTGYLNVDDLSLSHYPLDLGPGSKPFQQNITGTVYASDPANGVSYSMDVSMVKQYSYSPDGLVMKSWGWKEDTAGRNIALSGIWGDQHNNAQPFEFRITDTLVAKQSCGWRMTSGVLKEHSATYALPGSDIYTSFTFGLDKDGHPSGCQSEGNYFFRAFWQGQYGAQDTTSVMIAY